MSAHDISEDPDMYAPTEESLQALTQDEKNELTGAGEGGAPADEVADMVSSIRDAGGRNLGDIEGDKFASKQELRDELEAMYHHDAMDEGVRSEDAITDAHVDAVWDSLGSVYVTEEERVGTSGGYDEEAGADAPSKEDIEAMEGLDIMQPDTGAGEGGGEDWRDQEVRTGYTGGEPNMEKWGDMVSDYAEVTLGSQGNMYEGQVLKINSKDDVQRFLDYTWTDKTGESIAPQGFVDAVWEEIQETQGGGASEGEAMAVTDVAIPEDEPTDAYEPSKMESKAREVDSIRGHKIMPKALEKKLPPLNSQDGKGMDATVHAKFFDPQGSATWYLTEYDPKTGDAFGYADMFGSGDSQSAEMGYFNVWEIGQTMGKMGIPMERDNYWTEKTINESIAE